MFARIKFDDSFHESFIVDATIENNRLYRNAHMGFEGSINNNLYPGRIDYGAYAPDERRYYTSNIHDHQIQVGEDITVRGYENDGQRNCEFTFKISQIDKTASLTTTNDDCDHPIFDLTLEACKRLGVIR
jgi:hypothetical protein